MFAGESRRIGHRLPLTVHASMRPRHVCRGKLVGRGMLVAGVGASMRPRHVCRGKGDTLEYRFRTRDVLQ